mgnify:CR=1 FL=1
MILIEDKRQVFKKSSFSNYKKRDITKKLILSMYYGKLEESFFWACEMLCSNMVIELWNCFFILMCKYIHVYNPKLPVYLLKKFKDFKALASQHGHDLELRNSQEVRLCFCSIAMILCDSQKFTILDDLKYKFDFQIENLYENLKAPNLKYIDFIYKQHDPKEYIVSFNELIYHLQETKQKTDIHFWINWIIQYDILCRKKKKHILCCHRTIFMDKNDKLSRNMIWVIWDILLKMSKEKRDPKMKDSVESIFELFTTKYTVACNKSRIYMIYHCIELLLLDKQINWNIGLLRNKDALKNIETNMEVIFEQIKTHQVVPDKPEKTKLQTKMDLYQNTYNNL